MHFNDPTLRREVKFISNEIFLSKILAWISTSRLFFIKQFKQRSVNNIYYDTYGYDAYSDNLDGISKRVKLRYRWYGNNRTPNNGAIEIKKRLKPIDRLIDLEKHRYQTIQEYRQTLISYMVTDKHRLTEDMI